MGSYGPSGALNWREFADEALKKNRDRAMGLQNDGTAIGGLISAQVIELSVGVRLCRIAYSALPARMNISRAWWVREEVFVSFLRTSLAQERSLIDLIRDSLALSTDFVITIEKANAIRERHGDSVLQTFKNFTSIKPLDRIFTVEVTGRLLAFSGIGRDVADMLPDSPLGVIRTWRAANDIAQLFIPGLLEPSSGGMSETGRAALHFRRSHSLQHWREWVLDDLCGKPAREGI